MKKLLVISLLMIGCTKSNSNGVLGTSLTETKVLSVGTCYTSGFKEDLEKWEKQDLRIAKVVEVGVKNYRVIYSYESYLTNQEIYFFNATDSFGYVERNGKVIQCPIQFNGVR